MRGQSGRGKQVHRADGARNGDDTRWIRGHGDSGLAEGRDIKHTYTCCNSWRSLLGGLSRCTRPWGRSVALVSVSLTNYCFCKASQHVFQVKTGRNKMQIFKLRREEYDLVHSHMLVTLISCHKKLSSLRMRSLSNSSLYRHLKQMVNTSCSVI